MSKQQVSNLFNSQEALGNISPLTAIKEFSGVRNGKNKLPFTMAVRIFQIYIQLLLKSVIMEAFKDQFTATELLSYKEVLYEEATEEWYAQRGPHEVDRENRNCTRLDRQFLMEEYRERGFTYVLF